VAPLYRRFTVKHALDADRDFCVLTGLVYSKKSGNIDVLQK